MFGGSISGDLLDASFGLDFTEHASSSTMLGAIDSKIKDMKRQKCQSVNSGGDSYTLCPWNGDISNEYLPTLDELLTEDIYLNRGQVKIESIKDEFEYSVQVGPMISSALKAKKSNETLDQRMSKEEISYMQTSSISNIQE
jgi:hypothetical protein